MYTIILRFAVKNMNGTRQMHQWLRDDAECQNLRLIKIQFWWFHVPLFLQCCGQANDCIIYPPNSSLRSAEKTDVFTSAYGLHGHHVLAMSSTQSKHFVLIFMIRNCSMATVQGLIISDVNFNFSCFVTVHNNILL